MNNLTTPIVRLEIEGFKHTLVNAFSKHLIGIDDQVRKAVEQVCSPENIDRILLEHVDKYIKQAIEEEMKSFFIKGDGRKFIREKVAEKLNSELKEYATL